MERLSETEGLPPKETQSQVNLRPIKPLGQIALDNFEHDPFIDGLKFELPPVDYP